MTPDVEDAIREIRELYADHNVEVEEEPQGGAYVIVHDVALGEQYQPSTSWIGFLITFQYPAADVYPHFIDGSVQRANAGGHGSAFQTVSWRGHQVLQVSRRSNRWNPALDTAALKLTKVIEWIRAQ